MVSSKSIALVVLLVAIVTVDAEGFFARRRNQKKQQNYQQHLMGSNFHQRFGPQVSALKSTEMYTNINNRLGNYRAIVIMAITEPGNSQHLLLPAAITVTWPLELTGLLQPTVT